MKITAVLFVSATLASAVSVAACGPQLAPSAVHRTGSASAKPTLRHPRINGAPETVHYPSPPASPAWTGLTVAQKAAMSNWYDGKTLIQVATVCGDVAALDNDDIEVSEGTGVSALASDTVALESEAEAALGNPPPVAADAVIWREVLNAYINAAGDSTDSGLAGAVRMADDARWGWAPSTGSLLGCLNVSGQP